MNPHFTEVLNFLKSLDSRGDGSISEIVEKCIRKGFSPVKIIVGITSHFGIPSEEAKKIVAAHPAWEAAKANWNSLHDALEAGLEKPLANP